MLANSVFAEWLDRSPESLIGDDIDWLGWEQLESAGGAALPWVQAIQTAESFKGVPLLLPTASDGRRHVVVNGAPVLDGWNRAKGAIVTIDDVTELERKSAELENALAELELRHEEIDQQKQRFEVLAMRDPLTGAANRRAFLGEFGQHFALSKREGVDFCCLMVDIDYFKKVNDAHGHGVGDEVIKSVSQALVAAVRGTDTVCRYGGEEFCVSLPNAPIEAAVAVAERIRARIESPGFSRVPVTASFGVSSVHFGAAKAEDLINQADEALYASKENGRNRVTRWDRRGKG